MHQHDGLPIPKAMTTSDIKDLRKDSVAGLKCAFEAGPCLPAHEFSSSAATNKRTHEYGYRFENSNRLPVEAAKLTRETVPKDIYSGVSAGVNNP